MKEHREYLHILTQKQKAEIAKERDEVCPGCAVVGGYCGGSFHISCGCFQNFYPISLNELEQIKVKNGTVKS